MQVRYQACEIEICGRCEGTMQAIDVNLRFQLLSPARSPRKRMVGDDEGDKDEKEDNDGKGLHLL